MAWDVGLCLVIYKWGVWACEFELSLLFEEHGEELERQNAHMVGGSDQWGNSEMLTSWIGAVERQFMWGAI
jgi:hypothetical protein